MLNVGQHGACKLVYVGDKKLYLQEILKRSVKRRRKLKTRRML